MIILPVAQGTPAWDAVRAKCRTASEAPAMMGASKYQTRNDLLRIKSTGVSDEIDADTQRRFDAGHSTEASARVIFEDLIGEELFPVTATDDAGWLLASFDGMTMDGETLYEHKLYNEELAAAVRAKDLPPAYYWQLEQQLFISGAKRVIFVTSDGTRDKFESMEYRPVPGRVAQLVAGWNQFDADLATHKHEPAAVAVAGKSPLALPALHVQLVGQVTSTNLATYRETVMIAINGINTDLQTDQDFADAELAVKFCGNAETELETVKRQALAQTASIDELFRTVDALSEALRAKRLTLNKLVESRKKEIRISIANKGKAAIDAHMTAINARIHPVRLADPAYSIDGAMKGKRTLDSLRGAVDDEVARVKIAASQSADLIDANLRTIRAETEYQFLFADLQSLAMKPHDDLVTLIAARISEHKAKEAARIEADRARIRAEEEKRAKDSADAQSAKDRIAEAAAKAVEHLRDADDDAIAELAATPARAAETFTARCMVTNVGRQHARPSNADIIAVLSRHYGVTDAVVTTWLPSLGAQAA